MRLRTAAAVLAASLMASACVIVPVTTASYDPECRYVTHHMELKAVEVSQLRGCSDRGCEIMVLAAAGVTAVSTIVSGSIVVIGNVAYWADHRVNCPPPASVPATAPAPEHAASESA